ncbi:hypothetical protein JTE90_024589 [Oedothorax gibbosus]|uniref:Glucose-methanol-choline oxidoreductase N-terminal domain-containing protein n=1 Tax=Oedothorax gibbosus TaxID=931172 RepID=A0AAV6VF56_9ARAC|nr:hypothetical protein JTE90_024589 [Oedothorax gibbosus]
MQFDMKRMAKKWVSDSGSVEEVARDAPHKRVKTRECDKEAAGSGSTAILREVFRNTMDLARENAYPTPFANSTLLPLLLLSLMQQKHAPSKTDTILKDEYDFIIVGAGSAGSVVASRLSEVPCVSVLLLEAGPSPPLLTEVPGLSQAFYGNSDITWHYKTVPQKHTAKAMVNNQLDWIGGKTLGGTSTINGMLYVRGTHHDYDNWARKGAIGWSYSDIKPYFLKAEDNQDPEYLANGYHAVEGPLTVSRPRERSIFRTPIFEAAGQLGYKKVDFNGRNPIGVDDTQTTIRNGQRCSTAKAYLVPAENRTNLDIATNAFVRKVMIRNKKAEGVILDYKGQVHAVRARREVILSAGTVNSAQLLLLSGIGPKAHLDQLNIPVVADLPVGENLQDHIGSYLLFSLDPSVSNFAKKPWSPESFQDYIQHRKGPLSTYILNALGQFTTPWNRNSDSPDYQLLFFETDGQDPFFKFGFKPEIVEKYFGPYRNSSFFHCAAIIMKPISKGTLKLVSTNPYDPPHIDPNHYSDPDDYKPMIEGLKLCNRLALSDSLKKIGIKSLNGPLPGCEAYYGDDDLYFNCVASYYAFSVFHRVGTVKMGNPYDPTTVLCPRLNVKGVSGLRVVDASVMPTIPAGNTNAPTIMVAEKAVDIIKYTIDCYTQTPV